MTPEERQQVEQLFKEAIELEPPERQALLDRHCGGDLLVREHVESLLGHHEMAEGFLSGAPWAEQLDVISATLDSDRRVGRYRLLRVLAAGGMGVVYEAEQDDPRRRVAVKLIRMELVSPGALARFRREVGALARLRHDHVAQIYEAGVHETSDGGPVVPFFAMELVENARPITTYAATADLDRQQLLRMFLSLCDAVHHGHLRGVVHRDLKPANVLVDGDGRLKVIDFGVAKATDSDLALTTGATATGELVGTLRYMSPEQCSPDTEEIDHRTDVYSLGVTLYELLTGNMPYAVPTNLVAAALAIQQNEPRRPSTMDPQLKGDVETILLTALHKSADHRYQSAEALGRDVRDHLEHRPIAARPPSTIYVLSRWARRRRWMAAGLAVAVLSLLAGTTLASIGLVRARAEATRNLLLSRSEKRQREIADQRREESDAVAELFIQGIREPDPFLGSRDDSMITFLDRVGKGVMDELTWAPVTQARLLTVISQSYLGLEGFESALPFAELAVRILESEPRATHEDLVQARDAFAASLRRTDRNSFERLIEEWVQECRDAGHEREDHFLGILAGLGHARHAAADYEQARVLTEELVEAHRSRRARMEEQEELVEAHRSRQARLEEQFATALDNLARIQRHLGEDAAAEALGREALDTSLALQGEDHPSTARRMWSLAEILRDQRRYQESERLFRRSIEILEEVLGEDHVELSDPLGHLATLLAATGEFREAEEAVRRSGLLHRAEFGEDDIYASQLVTLAFVVHSNGRTEEALALVQEALDLLDRLGSRHYHTYADSWTVRAHCLRELGDSDGACEALIEAVSYFEAAGKLASDSGHAVVQYCIDALEAAGRREEAEDFRTLLVEEE